MGQRFASYPAKLRRLLTHPFRLSAILAWAVEHKIGVLLAVGVVLRLAQYLANRTLWLDEGSLAGNINGKAFRDLFGPLAQTQLAPPGFLVVEWLVSRSVGGSPQALRFLPLVGGIASLFLFGAVARRTLKAGAVWVALALFVVSNDLIYFASELKQYSTDVAVGLACLLVALRARSRGLSPARAFELGAVGSIAVWFSHPVVFVLAGMGTSLFVAAAARRNSKECAILSLIGLTWAASFAGVYFIAQEQLGHRRDMWVFWDFAFPPLPPRSVWDVSWCLRRFSYFFVNPLDFDPLGFRVPLVARLFVLPPLLLFFLGCGALWRVDRLLLAMLLLPILLTMLAAYLRLYPFHGRLVLFLVPSFFLLIAAGAGRGRGRSRRVSALVLASTLLFPALSAAYHLAVPRDRGDFNPHGDLRPRTLDPYRFPF